MRILKDQSLHSHDFTDSPSVELWQELGFGTSLAAVFLKVPKALKVGGLNLLDVTFCMISADFSSLPS